jgi:hypothetical protein
MTPGQDSSMAEPKSLRWGQKERAAMRSHPAVNHSTVERAFPEHRRLPHAVAYRVLGSVTEAEDAAQNAWLSWVASMWPPSSDQSDSRSHGQGDPLFTVYLAITLLGSVFYGLAAIANFVGHEYPKSQADTLGIPRSWMRPLGALLAAGAVGLLSGIAVPVLGTIAAGALVLYFLGAFTAHLRARDYHFAPWGLFFSLAVAALAVNLAYR